MVASFIDLLANLQVFLKTLRQESRMEEPSLHFLGFSDIREGSKVHISAKREMQEDFRELSLNLFVFECASRSSIRVFSTKSFSTTSSL
jgi:hypothetical protein